MANTLKLIEELKKSIKSKLIYIISISLLFAILIGFKTKLEKNKITTYSKIFPLSINKMGGGPMDALKSQLGISDKTDFEKIYNIEELINSKNLSYKIVKASVFNKKYKKLADWLIADYNKNLPFYKNKIVFKQKDSNDVIYTAAGFLLQNTEIKIEKSGFTSITTKSFTDSLSKEMNDIILVELSNLYLYMSTEKPRSDMNKIRVMKDSLKDELYAVERAIAGFQDANQLSVKYSTNIPQAKLLRTQAEIEALYNTTSAAYQNSKFKLLSESPIFQVLDYAGPPYNSIPNPWKKYLIISFFGMFFLLSLFFCRKVFWKIMIQELSRD